MDVKKKKNGALSNLRDYSYYARVLCIQETRHRSGWSRGDLIQLLRDWHLSAVAGTFLSRPDVPTQLTQPAVDAGGFLNSAHQSRPDHPLVLPLSALLFTFLFCQPFIVEKIQIYSKSQRTVKPTPCIHCPPSTIVRHEPCPSQTLTASLLLCTRQQPSHFYLNHSP